MPTLTIVIPTYKRPGDLAEVLKILRPQIFGRADRALIVVNDGTHDEAYQAVLDAHDRWFTYLAKEKNGGPAAARNYAARHAANEFIVFTDDDCRPPSYWLDYIQSKLEAEPWLDGVAGYTRPHIADRKSLKEYVIAHSGVLPGAVHDEVGRLICAVTAALCIRRSYFAGVKGFDESFRPSGEDLDFIQRCMRAGAVVAADERWWTGHITTDTIKAYLKRYFTYGEGSARYCMTRRDWTHPDVRNMLRDGPRRATVKGWALGVKNNPGWKKGTRLQRLALYAFTFAIARQYGRGFASGALRFAPKGAAIPTEPWLLWPRLGVAADGLPRR